jgi:hypothetical protein
VKVETTEYTEAESINSISSKQQFRVVSIELLRNAGSMKGRKNRWSPFLRSLIPDFVI